MARHGATVTLRPQLVLIDGAPGLGKTTTVANLADAQLAEVLRVCHRSKSLSGAGRAPFAVSHLQKSQPNDADRNRAAARVLRPHVVRVGHAVERAAPPSPSRRRRSGSVTVTRLGSLARRISFSAFRYWMSRASSDLPRLASIKMSG